MQVRFVFSVNHLLAIDVGLHMVIILMLVNNDNRGCVCVCVCIKAKLKKTKFLSFPLQLLSVTIPIA